MVMISGLISLIIVFGILLVFVILYKMVKIGITLAVIVGIVAIVIHFFKKKSSL